MNLSAMLFRQTRRVVIIVDKVPVIKQNPEGVIL